MSAQDSLKTSAARGAATVFSAQIVRIGVQTISTMILARLLTPSDYGLVAMVMVVVAFADIFRDFGLSAAAIQAKTLSRGQRTNLWWANTVIGLVIAVLLVIVAPLVADVFHDPRLTDLVRVLSVVFVINGAATQYRASLTRSLRFGTVAWTEVAAAVVSLLVGVALALTGFGYWALALMQITVALSVMVTFVVVARWLPTLPRRHEDMGGLLHFGGFLVGSQLINYAASNVDSFILGRWYGAAVTGTYDRPYRLLMMPLAQIRTPSTSVALPVLSKLQDDQARYSRFLLRGQTALGLGLVVPLGFVAGAAVPAVAILLGPNWASSAPILALLAIAAGLRTLSYVSYWVYLSRALTAALMRYSTVSALIKMTLIIIGGQWGAVGVAAAGAVAGAIEWPLSLWWVSRLTVTPLRGLVTGALRICALAGAAMVAAAAVVATVPSLPALAQLALAGLGALGVLALLVAVVPAFRRDVSAMRPAIQALSRKERRAA